jgi:hypothetical protein
MTLEEHHHSDLVITEVFKVELFTTYLRLEITRLWLKMSKTSQMKPSTKTHRTSQHPWGQNGKRAMQSLLSLRKLQKREKIENGLTSICREIRRQRRKLRLKKLIGYDSEEVSNF